MIVAYLAFLALGIVAFLLTAKFSLPIRIAVALAVFVIPSIVLTVWVARVGDKPPPDAITVVPKPSATPEKTEPKDSTDK